NPGLILPGVLGSLSLVLALYAMQMLPINYSGLLLIFIGVILLIAEVSLMSYGLLALSGAISIFLGSIMLIDSDDPAMQISKIILYPTLGMTFLVSIGSIYLAKKTHQLVTTTGMEGLLGEIGVVKKILNLEGLVLIHGEMWKAESDTVILVGEKVSVEVVKGLKIKVRKVGG
ncbi:MAG: nodulation protein NfeD, partial [Nitrospina sp.]|nr:nodulation protein NfeD [Nitrospina sp.]